MSYKRDIAPPVFARGGELTSQLIGIGFRLAGEHSSDANIENALVSASIEGMEGDLRVLSLLVDWIDVHSERVNADRLFKLISVTKNERVRAFWKAIATWKSSDSRFKRFSKLYRGPRMDLLKTGTDFHIARHGEDPRFKDSALRVPDKAGLRHRPSDILTPEELSRIHLPYRCRLIIGPTYRADMWAQLDLMPEMSAAELARSCYGSFATAWKVKHEWAILNARSSAVRAPV
jgi:hypothetical protein